MAAILASGQRIVAVVTTIVGVTTLATSLLVRDAVSSLPWWLAVAALVVLWWWLRLSTGSIVDGRASRLDERELQLRHFAGWCGQLITLVLLAAITVLAHVVARTDTDQHLWLMRIGGVILSAAVVSALAPTVLLAWLMAADRFDNDGCDDEADERNESV